MSTVTVEAVEAAIDQVIDPCSMSMGNPMGLVTMGLIEEIGIEGGDVSVSMVLTDSACAFYGQMNQYMVDMVSAIPGVDSVRVEICGTKLWSRDRMRLAPEGRTSLPVVALAS